MKTIIYDWKEEIKKEELDHVKEVLDKGGVVIFPTDTVYGIGCNCFNEEAIDKLFEFKQRDYMKPINVLTSSKEQIEKIAIIQNETEDKIIKEYTPGALTIILKKKETVPDLLTSQLNTVGVRIPNNKIALQILKIVEYPLATTSVNLSGEKAGIQLSDFADQFQGKVDIIIDGGVSDIQLASTIVKVENNEIKILREGTVKIKNTF